MAVRRIITDNCKAEELVKLWVPVHWNIPVKCNADELMKQDTTLQIPGNLEWKHTVPCWRIISENCKADEHANLDIIFETTLVA